MHVFHFTHSDLDGLACSLVAKFNFPNDKITTVICDYGDKSVDEAISKFLESPECTCSRGTVALLVTDIAPSLPVCKEIDKHKNMFSWLLVQDHHKTVNWSDEFDWFEHDKLNERCGAKMLYDWGHRKSDVVEDFVMAVDAYDRWCLDSPYRKRGEVLNDLLKFIGHENFLLEFEGDFEADRGKILPVVRIAKRKLDADVISVAENPQVLEDSEGRWFAFVVLGDEDVSSVGHKILELRPDVSYVAMVIPKHNVVSLRSRKNQVDVSEIAKKRGGGGHREAAGFVVDFKDALLEKCKF